MKKTVSIIGSGPAALMLAASLDEKKFDVTIFEKNFSPARKFLVAGDGGFNLTHSEDLDSFIKRYSPPAFMEKALRKFSNANLQEWFREIGIETYVGTSKRVFPVKGVKPIDVLNAILNKLNAKGVKFKTLHQWVGWDDNDNLIMLHNELRFPLRSDYFVFALGGASWSKTGTDGLWLKYFEQRKINTIAFQASNCAYKIEWTDVFLSLAEGQSLKNISLKCGNLEKRGEVVITQFGLEGGAIYALSPQIREQLSKNLCAEVTLDLKPIFTLDEIRRRLSNKGNSSVTDLLKDNLNLTKIQIDLLKNVLSKDEFLDLNILSQRIKYFPLKIIGMAPLEDAISTVGGIALSELDKHYQLKKMPHHYAIGEMCDWDAPTGGYLLQGCFSMGNFLAHHLNSTL